MLVSMLLTPAGQTGYHLSLLHELSIQDSVPCTAWHREGHRCNAGQGSVAADTLARHHVGDDAIQQISPLEDPVLLTSLRLLLDVNDGALGDLHGSNKEIKKNQLQLESQKRRMHAIESTLCTRYWSCRSCSTSYVLHALQVTCHQIKNHTCLTLKHLIRLRLRPTMITE